MSVFGNLFGKIYNRDGAGVEKDEPRQPDSIRFFQLFARKFGLMIKLNLAFLIAAVPVAVIMYFLYHMSLPLVLNIGGNQIKIDIIKRFVMPVALILLSPFIGGLSYVTRSFIREEHTFVFSDFFENVKSNFKFFFLNGIFLYFVYVILSLSFEYYYYLMFSNFLLIIPFILTVFASYMVIAAQFYIPLMAVTFDLSFSKLYKNAFIFAILALWRNLLIVLLIVLLFIYAVIISPVMLLFSFILIAYFLLFGFSFSMYTVNFITYPVIEKYLINAEAEPSGQKEEQPSNLQILSEEEYNSISEIKSEYVYKDGKLIKREDIGGEE